MPLSLGSDSVTEQLIAHIKGMFYKSKTADHSLFYYVSEGCEKLTGYTSEELTSGSKVSYSSLIFPGDIEKVKAKREMLHSMQVLMEAEYRIICRDGKIKWVQEIAAPVINEEGKTIFIEGFVSDITTVKNASLITKTFDSFERAINSASIVSITDKQGFIIYANDKFRECSGYSALELAGQNHRIVNSGYHESSFFENMWQTILAGGIWRGEICNRSKEGKLYWVDTVISPVRNEKGEIEQFLSIRNLITDRKKAELALKESELFSRSVLASLEFQIAVINPEGIIYKANNAWKKGSGFLNTEFFPPPVEGTNYVELCEAAAQNGNQLIAKALVGIKQVMNDNCPAFHMEYCCNVKGQERWYRLSVSRMEKDGHKIVLCNADITAHKQAELMLAKTIKELTEKNTELLQFNYIVSHNFRAPVATILGLCNLFKLETLSETDKLAILQNIMNSAVKMDEMIRDLSAILSARSSLTHKKQKVALIPLINSVKDIFNDEIAKSGTEFRVEIHHDTIYTIKNYMESILFNLISNAIKYRSLKRKPRVSLVCRKENDIFILEVSDNGIGINLEKYGSQLFGLYKRFNVETEGKGLGLHMVKTQVNTLGGTINIQSKEHSGTVFTVSLPLQ